MSLPRSTYYYRPRMPAEEMQKKAADLRDRIEAIVEEFYETIHDFDTALAA